MHHIRLLLMIILFNISNCGNYPQKEKRSVFGMIENIRKKGEGKKEKEHGYGAVRLVKVLDNEKTIEYQELKKILLVEKRNQEANEIIYQIRRDELKRKFLQEFRMMNDKKFLQRRREDMLTNFSFLTKLS